MYTTRAFLALRKHCTYGGKILRLPAASMRTLFPEAEVATPFFRVIEERKREREIVGTELSPSRS